MTNCRWLRLYVDSYRHPKTKQLSDRAFRFWITVLCLCAERETSVLHTVPELCRMCAISVKVACRMCEELKSAGLVSELENGRLEIHNWHKRQYVSDNSTQRVREFRERKRNVSETAQNRTDTDTEQKQSRTETEAESFDEWMSEPPEPEPSHAESASSRPAPAPSREINLPPGLSALQAYRMLERLNLSTPELEAAMERCIGDDWRSKLMREENARTRAS